jgi:hydrogenase-4 component B
MNGADWTLGWLGYLVVTLIGGGVTAYVGSKRGSRLWLFGFLLLGAIALCVMAFSVNGASATHWALPAPWPTLTFRPLPLAALWSFLAGLLFFASALLAMERPDAQRIFYALIPLLSAVGVYLWSGDGLVLILSWEFLSAVTYLGLVTTRRSRSVFNAGWTLLALSEFGGILLLVAIVWLIPTHAALLNDSFTALKTSALAHDPLTANIIMILAVLAFGVKAGLFPVMIWMPAAEPEAPGMVAGVFSGLITALAVSGILAFISIAGRHGVAWAVILLVLGVLGTFSGALYSVVSRHVKRILAYSTLEIMGMVFSAMAIWRIASWTDPSNVVASLALDAAVILLIVHAGSKFVLFAVTDYSGRWSHMLDGLGGLIHDSRTAGIAALLAVAALGAFPPLGGFVGEWLLLESVLKPLTGPSHAAIHLGLMVAGSVLALSAAIGIAAYLRWYGFIFLGMRRRTKTAPTQTSRAWRVGLVLPLVTAFVAGPGVPWLLPWANHLLASYLTTQAAVIAPSYLQPSTAAPLIPIGVNLIRAPGAPGSEFFPQAFSVNNPYVLWWMALFLTSIVALIRYGFRRHRGLRLVNPWNGGAEPLVARASWSAEGFTHPIRLAFARFYGLERARSHTSGVHFYRHTIIYRLEEQGYRPLLVTAQWVAAQIRRMQSGRVNQYIAWVWLSALLAICVALVLR